ncbi:MAG: glycosyltransferase family 4 protein [Bradymonadaceae bacterium]
MNILFLTEGTDAPASRYRCEQFIPHLERAGFSCDLAGAYGTLYNQVFETPIAPLYKLATRAKRGAQTVMVGDYDLVFAQRLALPHTALPEIAASLRRPVILDFDDAFFLDPDGERNPIRERAFRVAVDRASQVIAGNRYLADWADAEDKTEVIPTVIDTGTYRPPPVASLDPPRVIGWMGTASNFVSLRPVLPAVEAVLEARDDTIFRLVSNAKLPELEDHPQVEQIAWTARGELRWLQSFDVGLMPLLDNPSTRGKCGFKMIQYMAVGVPVVASPVGANTEILEGSGAGYFAEGEGWSDKIEELIENARKRRAMGREGREYVVENYSVESVIERYIELFETVID